MILLRVLTALVGFACVGLNAQTRKNPDEKPERTPTKAPAKESVVDVEKVPEPPKDRTSTIDPAEIKGWDANSPEIIALLLNTLSLTRQNLKYTYGSADPKNGGMDCSGTIYYLLSQSGIKEVPRQANLLYVWTRKAGQFRAVISTNNESFEFDELKPGDLLFWTGTYSIERDPPVTHVMIYLGRRKSDNGRVMAGASEGRRYGGQSRYGVSVFDFRMPGFPPPKSYNSEGARFIGYGRVPGLPKVTPKEMVAPLDPPDTSPAASDQTMPNPVPPPDVKPAAVN